jgi:hypothetical protein
MEQRAIVLGSVLSSLPYALCPLPSAPFNP